MMASARIRDKRKNRRWRSRSVRKSRSFCIAFMFWTRIINYVIGKCSLLALAMLKLSTDIDEYLCILLSGDATADAVPVAALCASGALIVRIISASTPRNDTLPSRGLGDVGDNASEPWHVLHRHPQ